LRRSLRRLRNKQELAHRKHRPDHQAQTRSHSKNLCAKRPVLPYGRRTPGRRPPILRVHRTALIIRNRTFRTRPATAATFRPAQALTAHSAQTTAPISRSTVGRDGSAKNLLDSEWRANGISPIAVGGAGTKRHVTSTARGWAGSCLTMKCGLNPTIPIAGLLASSTSAGGLAGRSIYISFCGALPGAI
jgi:hypothetical protein